MTPLGREWVRKAEFDRRAARTLRSARPVVHSVFCFLCQQAAEKYLKIADAGATYLKLDEAAQKYLSLTDAAARTTFETRREIQDILAGRGPRLLVVSGPCSMCRTSH